MPTPMSLGLARALFVHHTHFFTFVHEDGVEPTNDVAERTLRTAVQWRKIKPRSNVVGIFLNPAAVIRWVLARSGWSRMTNGRSRSDATSAHRLMQPSTTTALSSTTQEILATIA